MLTGAADALYDGLNARRTPSERLKLDRWLQPLIDALGAQSADKARSRGPAMTIEDVIALARTSDDMHDEPNAMPEVTIVPDPSAAAILTSREQEVAVLLAGGLSNPQIADELVISVHTAQRHVENILGKLSVSSRTQVAAWAVIHGLLTAQSADNPRRTRRNA